MIEEILNKLIIANITISTKRYFITTIERTEIYLHKDGTIHNYCGSENFFDTYMEAKEFLDKIKKEHEFIKPEEFMIE